MFLPRPNRIIPPLNQSNCLNIKHTARQDCSRYGEKITPFSIESYAHKLPITYASSRLNCPLLLMNKIYAERCVKSIPIEQIV